MLVRSLEVDYLKNNVEVWITLHTKEDVQALIDVLGIIRSSLDDYGKLPPPHIETLMRETERQQQAAKEKKS